MSRIKANFEQLAANNKKALVPYIVCADFDGVEQTVEIMHALVKGGADVIELGVAFSDPMAEGPVIQLAHERALANGSNVKAVLECVEAFRKQDQETPVVLMGYANPIEKMGYEQFASQANKAGVDGVLTVDLPYEEVEEFSAVLKSHDIDNIFLLTPTTSHERAQNICRYASGYLYYVSLKGVTGAGHLDADDVQQNYQRLSGYTDLPICVGFGIKDAETATAIGSFATGVVIGSALIKHLLDQSQQQQSLADGAQKWIANIRQALNTI